MFRQRLVLVCRRPLGLSSLGQVAQMWQLYDDRIQYASIGPNENVPEDLETKVQQAMAALSLDLQQALKVERHNRKDAVER